VLEAVTRRFGELVEIRWHAYELRPDPVPLPDPDSEYIAEHWENRVLPMAAERGLIMRVPRRQVRSRRALQAALFAREQGRFREMDRLIYRARFEEDADLGDPEVLSGLAADAGLDGEALRYALKTHAYLPPLEEDLAIAHAIGIRGVPMALVGPANEDLAQFLRRAEPVSGAVPEEWMMDAVERARTRAVPP
jgi:predicted DsbA family dithiol-disulfide isomerase